jgi:hypothetical protein
MEPSLSTLMVMFPLNSFLPAVWIFGSVMLRVVADLTAS